MAWIVSYVFVQTEYLEVEAAPQEHSPDSSAWANSTKSMQVSNHKEILLKKSTDESLFIEWW